MENRIEVLENEKRQIEELLSEDNFEVLQEDIKEKLEYKQKQIERTKRIEKETVDKFGSKENYLKSLDEIDIRNCF
ncbi:hypothetical protein BKP56_07260 [Marinilactibacillus sp. 15R]|uniref:hypothetical protein n=1 Tax=Marinilactibacillus sp. 15R TaxID=1911586 RepID=UPI00090A080B|nr:hypothetical protein [Marinilactibacillus sp. 15R]API89063.1 hypothetical protein BKP56_07260 [Marinilactibacillus sp. 15R]